MSETSPVKDKRLTEAEWTEAKVLYETGKATKATLAAQFGISRQSISAGLAARGAVYGSKSSVIEAAVSESLKGDADKRIEEISAFKAKQKSYVEIVQKLTMNALMGQVRDKKPVSDIKQEIITLNKIMATLRLGRDELYHLYDLHRDPDGADEVEEFIVSDYSQDEIDALNLARLGAPAEINLEDLIKPDPEDEDDDLEDLLGS